MIESFFVHDVTIIEAGTTTDRQRNVLKSWDPLLVTETDVKGWMNQRSSIELLDGREAQVTTWLLTLPAGAPITAASRVRWNDRTPALTFEVDGDPNFLDRPLTGAASAHHVEIPLRRVAG